MSSDDDESQKKRCNKCKKVGHIAAKCPDVKENKQQKVKCFLCGRTGHMKTDCPTIATTSKESAIECFDVVVNKDQLQKKKTKGARGQSGHTTASSQEINHNLRIAAQNVALPDTNGTHFIDAGCNTQLILQQTQCSSILNCISNSSFGNQFPIELFDGIISYIEGNIQYLDSYPMTLITEPTVCGFIIGINASHSQHWIDTCAAEEKSLNLPSLLIDHEKCVGIGPLGLDYTDSNAPLFTPSVVCTAGGADASSHPGHILLVAQRVVMLKNISLEICIEECMANTRRLENFDEGVAYDDLIRIVHGSEICASGTQLGAQPRGSCHKTDPSRARQPKAKVRKILGFDDEGKIPFSHFVIFLLWVNQESFETRMSSNKWGIPFLTAYLTITQSRLSNPLIPPHRGSPPVRKARQGCYVFFLNGKSITLLQQTHENLSKANNKKKKKEKRICRSYIYGELRTVIVVMRAVNNKD
eukprot:gene7984-16339_t